MQLQKTAQDRSQPVHVSCGPVFVVLPFWATGCGLGPWLWDQKTGPDWTSKHYVGLWCITCSERAVMHYLAMGPWCITCSEQFNLLTMLWAVMPSLVLMKSYDTLPCHVPWCHHLFWWMSCDALPCYGPWCIDASLVLVVSLILGWLIWHHRKHFLSS